MVGSFVLLTFERACGVIGCLFHLSSHGALVYCQKCLEEKNEILQGKLSQLEEHLARLQENPPQEKGEVLGDVLQVGMRKGSHKTCVLHTGVGVGLVLVLGLMFRFQATVSSLRGWGA